MGSLINCIICTNMPLNTQCCLEVTSLWAGVLQGYVLRACGLPQADGGRESLPLGGQHEGVDTGGIIIN